MQKKIKLSEKLMEKHGKIRYRFMNAYLFATVFQKNQEALKDLIAALLRIELKEIVSLEILNPILPGQDIDHKSCIMDILVLLNGNIRVNLEMQVLDEGNWNERGVYYLAENLLDLKKGEDYKNLKTTVQIGILDFDLWKFGKNPFYQVYELWDTEHDRVFTNKMKLCVLSLRQAEKAEERERQSGLYDWAKALTAETWEELQELSEKNEKIKEAVETMITLTEDERVRIECMRQEKAERDWINAMNYATEQGEERGEARGMKMGIQKGMKQERENTLKLVAKMSQNGDTEYIARLLEPEVFERMAAKYGMKA